MTDRNFARESKLLNDWQYFKPMGPHFDDEPDATVKNLNEMSPADVERLLEVGDEMAEYIRNL